MTTTNLECTSDQTISNPTLYSNSAIKGLVYDCGEGHQVTVMATLNKTIGSQKPGKPFMPKIYLFLMKVFGL